ncbi:zinc finger and SCAN domain-containing protein 30-like [Cervus elaphus]|uniref:zinc finger and SCAN domain-containing protein 30-like n=1 Tax=Cervus elaphus TaxID=9860 RepID=UPI001CC2E774|nr:zinc finger and SCAN domain-containing protein 30-like [Cervus elaphus]
MKPLATTRAASLSSEAFHRRFRRFGYSDSAGPREALSQLHELCCQWLRPEVLSKEQILELLVLEQFLAILPEELQALFQENRPESREDAVEMLEEMEKLNRSFLDKMRTCSQRNYQLVKSLRRYHVTSPGPQKSSCGGR